MVGCTEGCDDGLLVGDRLVLGTDEGLSDGGELGSTDGELDGDEVGCMEGCDEGLLVGDVLVLGMSDGSLDGWLLGCDVG